MNLIAFSTATHIRSQIPCRDYNALYFLFLNSLRFLAVHSKDYSSTEETPMSVQFPDKIFLRNKDSVVGRFWARCTKVKFLSRTRLRIFLDHLESHNALSKSRRQSGASEPQRESEALLNFFRTFFDFFFWTKKRAQS